MLVHAAKKKALQDLDAERRSLQQFHEQLVNYVTDIDEGKSGLWQGVKFHEFPAASVDIVEIEFNNREVKSLVEGLKPSQPTGLEGVQPRLTAETLAEVMAPRPAAENSAEFSLNWLAAEMATPCESGH